jgi:hypothetical protein
LPKARNFPVFSHFLPAWLGWSGREILLHYIPLLLLYLFLSGAIWRAFFALLSRCRRGGVALEFRIVTVVPVTPGRQAGMPQGGGSGGNGAQHILFFYNLLI